MKEGETELYVLKGVISDFNESEKVKYDECYMELQQLAEKHGEMFFVVAAVIVLEETIKRG